MNPGNLKPPAKKGEIRNPKGKPKGTLAGKTIINRFMQAVIDKKLFNLDKKEVNLFVGGKSLTAQEMIYIAQFAKAMKGDTKAAEFLKNHSEGLLTQKSEITTAQPLNISFAEIPKIEESDKEDIEIHE